jgi:hypothetical protein
MILFCYKQPECHHTISSKTDHIKVNTFYNAVEYKLGECSMIDLIDPNDSNKRCLCLRKSDLYRYFLTQAEWREMKINQILDEIDL